MGSFYSSSTCLASKEFTEEQFTKFTKKIEYRFEDRELLSNALTHSSVSKKKPDEFQRLEHLGDAVLGVVITDLLYDENSDKEVGFLSEERKKYVGNITLVRVARKLDLLSDLKYDKDKSDPKRGEERLSSDTCEALIGAIFKDGGLRSSRKFILTHFDLLEPQEISDSSTNSSRSDDSDDSSSPVPKKVTPTSFLNNNTEKPFKNLKEFKKFCKYKKISPPERYEVTLKIEEKSFTSSSPKSEERAKQLAAKQACETLLSWKDKQKGKLIISRKEAIQELKKHFPTASYLTTRVQQNAQCMVSYNGMTETGIGKTVKEANTDAAQKLYIKAKAS